MIKNISYIRHYLIILTGLLAIFWLASCSYTTEEEILNPKPQVKDITVSVNIPGVQTPSTRGIAGNGENEVKNMDLLIFNVSGDSNESFQERVSANITNREGSVITFTAQVTPTNGNARIVVVANHSLEQLSESLVGKNKKEVLEMLLHSTTGAEPADFKWKAGASNYTPIPMYGESSVVQLKQQIAPVTGIQLTRMLARIDIINSVPEEKEFVVEDVYLVNYNTAGYIAPAWDYSSGKIIDPSPADPVIPGNNGKQTGWDKAIRYQVNEVSNYEGEIYTYEAPVAADGSNDDAESRKDAICLVVKGRTGSSDSYYYRVDFTWQNPDNLPDVYYMPIKRNYKYIINIEQIEGIGYASVEDAVKSYTVLSNLKTRVVSYDQSKIKDVVYNGQYMLGIGEQNFALNKYSAERTVSVFTDSPNGWKAKIADTDTWLSFGDGTKEITGEANKETQLVFKASAFDEVGSRTASITIDADRLTHTIKITQTDENPGNIKIVDEYGNPVSQLFFPLNKQAGAPDIEPQKIYVVWNGGTCKGIISAHDTDDDEVIYQRLDPQLSRTGETAFGGGIQAFTIQPQKGTQDVYWRWDWMYFRQYDENGNQIAEAQLKIDQGDLIFDIKDLKTKGYTLGSEYIATLETNAKWKITSVTATETSLSDLILSGGDLVVGKEGDPGLSTNNFNLSFSTNKWVKGRKGNIIISFEVDYVGFIFSRTVVLNINSSWMDYINGGNSIPRYYLYPNSFGTSGNPALMSMSTAQIKCDAIGSGWRLPTMSELYISYAYLDILGGYGTEAGWSWPHYWSGSSINNDEIKYLTVQPGGGWPGLYLPDNTTAVSARCVYVDPAATGTKYPYVETHNEGALIVSRDANGGVDTGGLFNSGETPTGSTNKVAQKLLVANSDQSTGTTWAQATTSVCTSGWRLPTQREAYLIWGLGGTSTTNTITSPGYDDVTWPAGYTKMTNAYWLLTDDGNNAWIFDPQGLSMYTEDKTVTWPRVRCVKSVE